MARMTDEEADYWDEYYTKNPPVPGPNGTGFYTRRKAELAAQSAFSITVDSFAADYLLTKATASHKTPAEIISEMIQKEIAATH
jgi:hypothetical protein